MINTLMIPLAFLTIFAFLLWCIIDTKRNWFWKLILVVAVPMSCLSIWRSVENYRGWATTEPLPQKFILFWNEVSEPDPKTGSAGEIYVLIRNFEGDNKEPRLYKVEYSRKFHEQLEAANKAARRGGGPIVFERNNQNQGSGDGSESGGEGREGEGQGQNDNSGSGSDSQGEFKFYRLPPAKVPEKK